MLITGGLQVPVTPLLDVVGSAWTGIPEQIVIGFEAKLNVVAGAGVMVIKIVLGVAHTVADGVNVYGMFTPGVDVLMAAGAHVPANPSIEVAGKAGGVVP